MDIISFNEAATANGRIEKFIENPDSNSGIVTVPKVIGAGENITIPSGRMAVLPNVQVDGTLNVEGEVFIPSGSGLSTVVQKSGDTMTGNLNFASGTKITGDFSNATVSNRVAFQTSTSNNTTTLSVFPKGTGTGSKIEFYSVEDYVNNSVGRIALASNEFAIASIINGSGSYLPITFYSGGSERMRISTAGNVGIGTTLPNSPLVVGAPNTQVPAINAQFNGLTPTLAAGNGHVNIGSTDAAAADKGGVLVFTGNTTTINGYPLASIAGKYQTVGAGIYGGYLQFNTTNNGGSVTERMRIDSSGNVLVTGSGGLGYGTGSGGTVTQLTSKSTAVSLNKPTGQITMHNASLAAGGVVYFLLNNSLLTLTDTVVATFKDGNVADIRLYRVEAISQGTGYCWMKITNTHTAALAESPVITFAIIKGATV